MVLSVVMVGPFDPSLDAPDARERRRAMVAEQILARGIADPKLLEVLRAVPRHIFVPDNQRTTAYSDQAVTIGFNSTISQPYIVAFMTEALDVRPHHRVLEVGTGAGYQSAVLAQLASHVYTIERIGDLRKWAAHNLGLLGCRNVTLFEGDGSRGLSEHAPFDRIIVTAAAPEVPPALVDQLCDEGLMVIPVGQADQQTMLTIRRRPGRTIETPTIRCRFVPLRGQAGYS